MKQKNLKIQNQKKEIEKNSEKMEETQKKSGNMKFLKRLKEYAFE